MSAEPRAAGGFEGDVRIRRICVWGGPGSGKSVTAKWLAGELPLHGYRDVEYADEAVKTYARQNIPIEGVRQMVTFGKQVDKEITPLLLGVPLIVSDSPLALQAYYSRQRGESFWRGLYQQAAWVDEVFPALHVMLLRDGISYDPAGRYQTEKRAREIDVELGQFAMECGIKLVQHPTRDREGLIRLVKERVRP